MLKMIPRFQGAAEIKKAEEKLYDQDFKVSRRSIQRDLNKLSVQFPLIPEAKEGSRTNPWSWAEESNLIDIPEMSPLTTTKQ